MNKKLVLTAILMGLAASPRVPWLHAADNPENDKTAADRKFGEGTDDKSAPAVPSVEAKAPEAPKPATKLDLPKPKKTADGPLFGRLQDKPGTRRDALGIRHDRVNDGLMWTAGLSLIASMMAMSIVAGPAGVIAGAALLGVGVLALVVALAR